MYTSRVPSRSVTYRSCRLSGVQAALSLQLSVVGHRARASLRQTAAGRSRSALDPEERSPTGELAVAGGEGDPTTIGRPRQGIRVEHHSQQLGRAGVGRHDKDRLLGLRHGLDGQRAHVGDALSIGRPGGAARRRGHHVGHAAEGGHEVEIGAALEQDLRAVARPQWPPLWRSGVGHQGHGPAARLANVDARVVERSGGIGHELGVGRDGRLDFETGLERELRDPTQRDRCR